MKRNTLLSKMNDWRQRIKARGLLRKAKLIFSNETDLLGNGSMVDNGLLISAGYHYNHLNQHVSEDDVKKSILNCFENLSCMDDYTKREQYSIALGIILPPRNWERYGETEETAFKRLALSLFRYNGADRFGEMNCSDYYQELKSCRKRIN